MRALVRLNPAHVVNLIMRAHKNRNPAIGSSSSRRVFLLEGQHDENHFHVYLEHDDIRNGSLKPSRVVNLIWLAH